MLQKIYAKQWESNLNIVFLLGFASGIPFLLILSTLSVWLAETGISKTMIGVLAWVSIPYTFKFLFGAIVDHVKIPWLTAKLGLRRSWILLAQIHLWLSLTALGNTDPAQHIWHTAFFAFMVGCGSAMQDIAIEAYRIEILPPSKVGVGASLSVLGYRFGMLCSGAGTIFLAAYFHSWSTAYHCIAATMSVGIVTTLLSPEPRMVRSPLRLAVFKSLRVFVRKLDWQIIFPFILSYKIADTVLNVMSMPFLVEIGFDNFEIAYVAKTFGISAMILGGFIGGVISSRQPLRYYLLACVVLQAFASALFVLQAQVGNNLSYLFVTMGVENFTCGMSQVALVTYLSHLCLHRSIALHYAILSSFASFVRVSVSMIAGWLADHLAWSQFYALVCATCVPSILLLFIYSRHFLSVDNQILTEPKTTTGETADVY